MTDVYLDHAATTPMDSRVRDFLREALREPQNASSVHRSGQRARAHLEESREEIAALLGVKKDEVIFTSGSTEANNLAIRGFVAGRAAAGMKTRVLTSMIEHSCVRETVQALSQAGAIDAELMTVGSDGTAQVSADAHCDLLCLMAVQNETGILQRLGEARALRDATGARWLCDLTQGFGLLQPEQYGGADFYSVSSHKIHGPAGVGALVGSGLKQIRAQITGGPQEHGLRAGTQPVALIRAFAMAARLAREERGARAQHLGNLCHGALEKLRASGVEFRENGDFSRRLPGFLNISLPGIQATDLVIALDSRGFFLSAGSACATGVMETSPAMTAMFPHDEARAAGAVRITPGKDTTMEQMLALVDAVTAFAQRARR